MSDERMARRILMVLECNTFPSEGGGGAENQVRTLCRWLLGHGVPVSIAVPLTRDSPQREHDTVDGATVWRIRYPRIRWLGGLVMLTRLALYLIRHRGDYDVVHAHIAHNMATVSCIVGRMLGKTVIVKLTGWTEFEHGILTAGPGTLLRRLRRAALKRASFIQATSREIRDRLLENGFDHEAIRVIPNAVDLARFRPLEPDMPGFNARAEGTLTAIYTGRLVPEKGLRDLVTAWGMAFPASRDVSLLIVGDGEMRDELHKMVTGLGRERQIHLLGGRHYLERLLPHAHFGILPSHYEGLSNTLLEYMACALPVLGTRVSGTVDLIQEGQSGWLVDAGDVHAMAHHLAHIGRMERSDLARMGRAARRRVAARAGIESVMARLAPLYGVSIPRPQTHRPAVASGESRQCVE